MRKHSEIVPFEKLPLVGFLDVDPHQPQDESPIHMWEIVHALEAASTALEEMDAHCDPGEGFRSVHGGSRVGQVADVPGDWRGG